MRLSGRPLVHACQVAIAHTNGGVKAGIGAVQNLEHKTQTIAIAQFCYRVGERAGNLVQCGCVGPIYVRLRPVAACFGPWVAVYAGFHHNMAFNIIKP